MILTLTFAAASAFANPPPRPLQIVYALARDLVDDDGRLHTQLDQPYVLKVEEVDGAFYLSGYGMKNDRVRPYLTSRFKSRRALAFVSDDPKSTRRPVLIVRKDGFATLRTRWLHEAELRLHAISELNRPFAEETLVTNARGLKTRGWCAKRLLRPR